MKFILRDDDINYHYNRAQLSKWYEGITDICPISICIPAFVKGDFFRWCKVFESREAYEESDWLNDNKMFPIGDNLELVDYLKSLIKDGKASISMHGIYHRNEEMDIPQVENNFIRGAEFYTNNDYTKEVEEAKKYLENLFSININSFTPPQNMINDNGFRALRNNRLSVCADLIRSPRRFRTCMSYYGIIGYISILYYRFFKGRHYPYMITNGNINFIGHQRLQPCIKENEIIDSFEYCHKKNGIFVLSTHSYAFDQKMDDSELSMKQQLMRILNYSTKYKDIEYTTLQNLFNE